MKKDKQVCIVRARPHGINREEQFLHDGVVSIGYPDLGNLQKNSDELRSREEILELIKGEYSDHSSSLAATQVYAFITLPIGSVILTPSIQTRNLHLFETISKYLFVEKFATEEIGNPHQIHVKHLKTVSRTVFPLEFQGVLNAAKKAVTKLSGQNQEMVLTVAYSDSSPQLRTLPDDVVAKIEKTLLGLLESDSREIRVQAAIKLLDSSSETLRLKAIDILNS
jgi:predicted Mrr-cat superfamily restriction endonuclease